MTRALSSCSALILLAASPCMAAPLTHEQIQQTLVELTSSPRPLAVTMEYDACPSKLLTRKHRVHATVPLQLGYRVEQIEVTSTGSTIRLALTAVQPDVAARPAAYQQDFSGDLMLNAAEARALAELLDAHAAALGTYLTAEGGAALITAAAAKELAAALTQRMHAMGDARMVDAQVLAPPRAQMPTPDVQLCSDSVLTTKLEEKFPQEIFSARGAVPIANTSADTAKLREYLKNKDGKVIAYREASGDTSAPIGAIKALQLPTGTTMATGTGNEKIVNGKPVLDGDMPWSAAFMRTAPDGRREAFCGGSLITRQWVLTAAHCLIPDGADVIIGRTDLTKDGGFKRKVKHTWRHIDFGRAAIYDSDIALVELSQDVVTTYATLGAGAPVENSPVIVAGWGATEDGGRSVQTLSAVELNVTPQDTCVVKYELSNAPVTNNMFCASKTMPLPQDACQGDSGGGTFQQTRDERRELIGIVSFGKGCATPGYPGVYTKLAPFRPWLAEVQQATGVQ